jgi:hypothetical protein
LNSIPSFAAMIRSSPESWVFEIGSENVLSRNSNSKSISLESVRRCRSVTASRNSLYSGSAAGVGPEALLACPSPFRPSTVSLSTRSTRHPDSASRAIVLMLTGSSISRSNCSPLRNPKLMVGRSE